MCASPTHPRSTWPRPRRSPLSTGSRSHRRRGVVVLARHVSRRHLDTGTGVASPPGAALPRLVGRRSQWAPLSHPKVKILAEQLIAELRPAARRIDRVSVRMSCVRSNSCERSALNGVPTRSDVIARPPQQLRIVETVGNGQSIGPAGSRLANAGVMRFPLSPAIVPGDVNSQRRGGIGYDTC